MSEFQVPENFEPFDLKFVCTGEELKEAEAAQLAQLAERLQLRKAVR